MKRILIIGSLLVGLALIAVAGVTGCSVDAMQASTCSTSGDCAAGEVCDPGTSRCLPRASTTPALEVVPPSGNNQGWVTQEFPQPDEGPDGKIHLKLAEAVSVEGGVYASHDLTKVVPAQVVAWRDSGLPGRPKVQIEASTAAGKRDGDKETYLLWLNPGYKYSILVTPLPPFDEDYPPLALSSLEVTTHMKQDFVLDGNDRAVVVSGQVLQYGGSEPLTIDPQKPMLNEKGTKLTASVRIRAYQSDGSRRSTSGITDPLTGAFTFKVPAGVATYNIKVESASGGMPIPTLECTKIVLGLAPSQPGQPTQEIKPIELPSFRFPKLFSYTVRGKDGTPVAGAAVTFATEVKILPANAGFEECKASYSRTGYSDTEGKVKVLLLPGDANANQTYSVTVVSPPDSKYASQWTPSFEVGGGGGYTGDSDITLEPRYLLSGKVLREETGEALAGVNLEARGIATGSASSMVPATTATATTDESGQYQLYVDPGVYNLELKPPQNLGLPTIGLTAKFDGDVLGKVFNIPDPKVVPGQVLDPSGNPLPSAKVQMYELVPEIEKPLTHRAALRASALTDSQGMFGLLVPPKQ